MAIIDDIVIKEKITHLEKILTKEYIDKCNKFWKLFVANYKPEKNLKKDHHPSERRYNIKEELPKKAPKKRG